MKWYTKLLVALGVAVLFAMIAGMIYVVDAKYQMNAYTVQVGVSVNAAMLVNAETTYTDADHAIISAYNGERFVIVPENYKALLNYLRRDCAKPPFAFFPKEPALTLTICGREQIKLHGDADGDGALIRFETKDKRYTMHVKGGDLWKKLVSLCTDGGYKAPNLPYAE